MIKDINLLNNKWHMIMVINLLEYCCGNGILSCNKTYRLDGV
jgi:hypothetical protein